jgi:hypothetical protein
MGIRHTPVVGKPPRVKGAASSVRIVARCTPEERDEWQAAAARERVELSEAIRLLLGRWGRGEVKLKR